MTKDDPTITSAHFVANGSNGNGHDNTSGTPFSHLSYEELWNEIRRLDEQIAESKRHGADGESFTAELHGDRGELFRELERRYQEPLRADVRGEAVSDEFPEIAWSGIFYDWREIVAPCTEAALPKLWSALLVTIGLVVGRHAWVESPFKLFPNFYTLLVGQTANARKSTVLNFARELIRRLEEDIIIVDGIVSSEGIFEALKEERSRALGYADEFRSLLTVAKRQGTADILPKMNSLYDCPNEASITRKDKTTRIVEPFFSFISATPLEYAENLLGSDEIAGGVLNRYLVVCGKERGPKALVRPPKESEWRRIVDRLKWIAEKWSNESRRFDFSTEAEKLWREFYDQMYYARETMPSRDAQLVARINEHVRKIALVYALAHGETLISARSLVIAIELGKWLQASTLRVFRSVGLDRLSRVECDIRRLLERRSFCYRRDLQRVLTVSGESLSRALRSLEENGFVVLHNGREKTPTGDYIGGQVRPWVEAVRSDT